MGAWGHGAFQNDDALDFLGDLREAGSWKSAAAEIQRIGDDAADGEYIEAPDAGILLAAGALAAHQRGAPVAEWSDELPASSYPTCPDRVVAAIAAALPRAVRGPDSELRELWEESDDFKDWLKESEAVIAALA
jgi:hypothetical protein